MTTPIVLYLGPSQIDGAPIVALATLQSTNVKTGAMVQTWIMRADLPPHTAGHKGKDASICGSCPRRHSLGGDCYVTIHQAPLSVWKLWNRSGRPGENWTDEHAIVGLQRDARALGLRLGSYGDPAAVPWQVWDDLISALQPKQTVGYTHQWRTMARDWYRDHVMASCDTLQDAADARALGWRYFLAIGANVAPTAIPERAIECPATVSDRTCATCGACDGAARGASKVSIYLREHGPLSSAKAKRIAALKVL